jgi:hypothetical protein
MYMLTKLTSVLGELNQDQYYRILDVAAHLTAGVSESPYIGPNGNWFVGTTDTGVPAQGPPGPAGGLGEAPTGASQPYVRNGATASWQLLSPIDGGTF